MNKTNALLFIILIVATAITLFPIYWMVITSLKTGSEIFAYPPVFIPLKVTLSNYYSRGTYYGALAETAVAGIPWIINSFIAAIGSSAIGTLLIGAPAAYGLVRYLKNVWFARLILFMMMIPEASFILPYFIIISKIGWINTWWGLITVYLSLTAPLATWLLMGFFNDLPKSVEEAAQIDGLSTFSIFARISMPMAAPGIAVAFMINFMNTWNEILYALVLTYSPFPSGAQTAPLFLTGFIVIEKVFAWGGLAAAGTFIMLPSLIVGLIAEKYLVKGWTLGAVKG